MEDLYLKIAERLRIQVPELDHIDEDTGQLYPAQYDDRYEYPVLFPCCLIDAATVDFKDEKSPLSQRGTATIILKTAFKCDEDSHFSSSEHGNGFTQLRRRQAINRKVVHALHGYCFGNGMSPMFRIQARSYSLPGRVKVYETTINVNVTDSLQVGE